MGNLECTVSYLLFVRWRDIGGGACSNSFKVAPSKMTLPDYYDVVNEKSVITWKSLQARRCARLLRPCRALL